MGTRLIEEFLAKSGAGKCQDFRETMEWISKVRICCAERSTASSEEIGWIQNVFKHDAASQ